MIRSLMALALLLAPAAEAATLPATPVTLAAVAKTAKACDVVAVTGPASTLQFNNSAWPMVTFPVSTACPWGVTFDLSAQTLNWFAAFNVANLKVLGGHYAATDWHGAVLIMGFSNVTVEGITQTSGTGGIAMREGRGASVQSNRQTIGGIYIGGVTGFDVGYNVSLAAASDGVDIAGSQRGRVHHNVMAVPAAQNGAHPDAVQLMAAAAPYPTLSNHIEIDNNFVAGNAMGYGTHDGGSNIWVHDNVSLTLGAVNGTLYDCRQCAATNNRGSTLPGSAWQGGYIDSRLSPDAILCGNVADAYAGRTSISLPACTPAQLAAAAALVAR